MFRKPEPPLKNSRDASFLDSPVGKLLSSVESELTEREERRKRQCTPTRAQQSPHPSPDLSSRRNNPSLLFPPSPPTSKELKKVANVDIENANDKLALPEPNTLDNGPRY